VKGNQGRQCKDCPASVGKGFQRCASCRDKHRKAYFAKRRKRHSPLRHSSGNWPVDRREQPQIKYIQRADFDLYFAEMRAELERPGPSFAHDFTAPSPLELPAYGVRHRPASGRLRNNA